MVSLTDVMKADHLVKYLRLTSPFAVLGSGVLLWMAIVRSLRWRRYHAIHRRYGPKWDNGRGSITPEEAQKIILVSSTYDMPLLLNYVVAFALFKTYAIPSISKLLAATKELKSKDTISKRYADTEILLSTFIFCPISGFNGPPQAVALNSVDVEAKTQAEDPRCMIALARVNFLHSKYNISNDDYLYTLSLFILEPSIWARRWGWRELSPLEQHASYVFWAEIGRKMGIKDIPQDFKSMDKWSKEYERLYMVPAQSNYDVAGYTLDELMSAVPQFCGLKALAKRGSISTMDDVVREAMMYPKQPWLLTAFVSGCLVSVNLFQRYFLLPRFFPVLSVDNKSAMKGLDGKYPRLHPKKWAARPWYRPEHVGIIDRLWAQFLVKVGWHSEMPGSHLRSSGYRIEELGPLKFENAGHEEVMRMAAELQGCPIAGPWSLEGRDRSHQHVK